MDRKRGSSEGPAASGEAAEPAGPEARAAAERFGPLEVRRLRKDDGRSLIVFAREQREP